MSTNCSEQDVHKIKRARYSEDVSLNFVRMERFSYHFQHNFVAVSVAERESRQKNFDWYKKNFTRLLINICFSVKIKKADLAVIPKWNTLERNKSEKHVLWSKVLGPVFYAGQILFVLG